MRQITTFLLSGSLLLAVLAGDAAAQWVFGGLMSSSQKGGKAKCEEVHIHQVFVPEKKCHLFGKECPHRYNLLESAAIQRVPTPIRRTDFRFRMEAGQVTQQEGAPIIEPTCEERLMRCQLELERANREIELLRKKMDRTGENGGSTQSNVPELPEPPESPLAPAQP